MSVISIKEHWPNRSGTFETPLNSQTTRHWRVTVDNKSDNDVTIHAFGVSGGIFPDYLDSHPNNAFLKARRINIQNESTTWKYWDVTANYSSVPFNQREEEENDTLPIDRSTRISWESVQYEQAVYKDRDDKAFLNSAGTPYAAQLIDDARWVINFSKNLVAIPAFILTFNNVTNSEPYTIQGLVCPVETLKMQGLAISELQVEQDSEFFTLSGQMHYRQEGWKLSLLDEGIYASSNTPINDSDGNPVREPVPLDGSGAKLASPTPATAVFNDFDVYTTTSYDVLPF